MKQKRVVGCIFQMILFLFFCDRGGLFKCMYVPYNLPSSVQSRQANKHVFDSYPKHDSYLPNHFSFHRISI